ncbi:MAG: hypothetical protein ACPGRX_03015 [Bdellovibrionales bacterium]
MATLHPTYTRIKNLIEDTNHLFENSGGVNTDYADFATIALAEFRQLLNDLNMTDRQLKQIIRKGNVSHKSGNPDMCWASFMADYMTQNANANSFQTVQ